MIGCEHKHTRLLNSKAVCSRVRDYFAFYGPMHGYCDVMLVKKLESIYTYTTITIIIPESLAMKKMSPRPKKHVKSRTNSWYYIYLGSRNSLTYFKQFL